METLVAKLSDPQAWEEYAYYKVQCGNLNKREEADLFKFITDKEYLATVQAFADGCPVAEKKLISKMGSDRKRVVYTFGREFNYLLKLLTFMLLRRYESQFAPNLYSFRVHHGVKEAVKWLKTDKGLSSRYVFKLDIHDYFNSIDIHKLLPIMREALADDMPTYGLLVGILLNPQVKLPTGEVVEEAKGIMAGVPVSAFLANLFLSKMDWEFHNQGVRYIRYSDDIIVFADSAEERDRHAHRLLDYLAEMGLEVNPKKMKIADPGEEWTFLGMSYRDGVVDVAPASVEKLIGKTRRKCRSLMRWARRKGLSGEKAAKAFVRLMNQKLYDSPDCDTTSLTWSRWYFPLIDTTDTLRRIDQYIEDCVRYMVTGSRTNSRFRCTYDDIKALGFRSLVHEYYSEKELLCQRSIG